MAFTGNYISEASLQNMLTAYFTGGDVFKCALYTSSASLTAATASYTTTGEVVGTGYTAGGATLTPSVSLDGTTVVVTFANPSWAAATFTARGALIYNDTSVGDDAVAVLDFGSDKTCAAQTFTVTMPPANAQYGVLRYAKVA